MAVAVVDHSLHPGSEDHSIVFAAEASARVRLTNPSVSESATKNWGPYWALLQVDDSTLQGSRYLLDIAGSFDLGSPCCPKEEEERSHYKTSSQL